MSSSMTGEGAGDWATAVSPVATGDEAPAVALVFVDGGGSLTPFESR